MAKRLFDMVFSLIGIVVLLPFGALLALVIKLTSKGPVFYRGTRVGLHGHPFRIFKFRTMIVDAENLGASSTHEADSRITSAGSFMRKLKLDELPQLINIFLGDMSLVGPRPEVQRFVDLYTDEERAILTVRPGITDWASIRFHNEGEIIASSGIADADEAYLKLIRPEKLRLQLKYVKEKTLLVDVKLILDTISTLLRTRTPVKL